MTRAAPRLRVIGCGEAFDSGVGNNSCLLYDGADGAPRARPRVPTVLFDCGYQIPERLWALDRLYPRLDGIYLTHLHADHSFGIVPLLTRYWEEKRREPLRILGPTGTRRYLERLFDLGYPGMRKILPFKIDWKELRDGESTRWGELQFRCARSEHSVLNLAVRVEGQGSLEGLDFGVSGDGQLSAKSRALFRGARLLLHETFSRDPLVPVHSDLKTLSKFARESAIERMGVTHVSRFERSKVREMLSALRAREPGRWIELVPGLELEVMVSGGGKAGSPAVKSRKGPKF